MILTPSLSSSRSSLILLSEKIHEISYFSKDKEINNSLSINNLLVLGTSNPLGINTLLVSENSEDKRIVSRKNIVSELFISKNTEDKPISNYKIVVQISRIMDYYPRTAFMDSQLTEISNNLSTIHSKRKSLGWNSDGLIKL